MAASSKNIAILEGTNDVGEVEHVTVNNGGLDTNLQDQVTPPLDLFFTQEDGIPTTLTVDTEIDDTVITVADATAFPPGQHIGIFSGANGDSRFFFAEVISVLGLDLTLDTPIDFAFPLGEPVVPITEDMNVDGSIDTQIFAIRGGGPQTEVTIDITRIIVNIITNDPSKLAYFGDIVGGLTFGLVLRRVDGDTRNIWNVKQNEDFSVIAYDVTYLDQLKQADLNGLVTRMTFAGQEKHGVAIRLAPGDQLQLLVQDDLSSLIKFQVMGQGHITNM